MRKLFLIVYQSSIMLFRCHFLMYTQKKFRYCAYFTRDLIINVSSLYFYQLGPKKRPKPAFILKVNSLKRTFNRFVFSVFQ